MAKIIISSKGKTLQELDLGKTIIIGREVGDIKIKHPAVSARHAKIEKTGNSFAIHDMGSTNGTLVNDQSITSHELQTGDVITIGKYNLTFQDTEEEAPPTADDSSDDLGGRTMMMDPSKIQSMMSTPKTKKMDSEDAGGDVPKLFLAQASGAPKVISVDKDAIAIGSSDESDIQIRGITVGKTAALITKQGEDYTLEFKGGMAKLKVNGNAAETHTLCNGDKFSIGSFDFQFRTKF